MTNKRKGLVPKSDGEIMAEVAKDLEEEVEKGKFTKYCKKAGFSGPTVGCAKKAMTTGTTNDHKMATFYMNTVKPNGETMKDIK